MKRLAPAFLLFAFVAGAVVPSVVRGEETVDSLVNSVYAEMEKEGDGEGELGAQIQVREPSLLDFEWKKSKYLERLLQEKLNEIVVGFGISESRFRSSVVVLFALEPEASPIQKRDEKTSRPKRQPASSSRFPSADRIEFPELNANPLDFYGLFERYQSDREREEDFVFRMQGLPEEVPLVNRSEPKYGVSMVSMNVSLDSAIPAERAKALEEFVKKVFAPAFGDRLFVRTEVAPYIDKESPSFFDRLEKFQKLAYLSLILFTILLLSLIWKLIPTRRTPHELRLNQSKHDMQESKQHPEEEREEEDDETEERQEAELGTPGDLLRPDLVTPELNEPLLKAIARVERQIIELVKGAPSLSRIVIQDFVFQGVEEGGEEKERLMLSLAVLLETLAKYQIPAERFNVKPSVLRKFQDMRSRISKIEPEQRLAMLEEVYWILVSFSFLSEGENSFPTFHFMEAMSDVQIVGAISGEEPLAQAAVLLGINEKRASGVLNRFSFDARRKLFELMCSGQSLPDAAMKELVERMRQKAQSSAKAESLPASAREGIEVVAQMAAKLDFQSEFESVKTLFVNAPGLKQMLKQQVFFVALLSEAKREFLAAVFTDRSSEWMTCVIGAFDEAFKARVLEILPEFQKRMVMGSSFDSVSKALRMKTLEELEKEIRARIENRELGLSDIFEFEDDARGSHGDVAIQRAA